MKQSTILILLVLGCLAFSACGGGDTTGGNSPGDVVKKYMTALIKEDKGTALECIAPELRDEAAPMLQLGMELASAFAKSEGGLESVTILREEVEGDMALVGYQTRTKQGMERADTVRAQKIGGTWYIAQ